MSLTPYTNYKPSGVPWLGKAPQHWTVTRVKRVAPFQVGWTPPTGNDANFVGPNLWANISDLGERSISGTAKRISNVAAKAASMEATPKGSLLFSFKLSVGTVSFAGADMYTNEAIASFLPNERTSLGFLYYAAPLFVVENAATNIYGAKILNQDRIQNAPIFVPPLAEQTQIARFLDYETAKIDRLIEKQQQLIALLKEKRQAVISHAVTKGLNPDAPMKDSGVEWLGQVPAHWTVSRLKHHAEVIDCKHITALFVDDGIPVASIGEVKGWNVNLSSAKQTTRRFYELLIAGGRDPRAGDIIFTRNATVGEAALVPKGTPTFAMGQDVCLLRLRRTAKTEFILHCLKSPTVAKQLDLAMIGSTFKRVNVEDIRNLEVTLPPPDEQARIIEQLEMRLPQYDNLIEAAEATVSVMTERRTALISAAVTGKIDVRTWTPPEAA